MARMTVYIASLLSVAVATTVFPTVQLGEGYRATPFKLVLPTVPPRVVLLDGFGKSIDPNITTIHISDSYLIIISIAGETEIIGVDTPRMEMAHAFLPHHLFTDVNISCTASMYHNAAFQTGFASSHNMYTFIYAAFELANLVFDTIGVRMEYIQTSTLFESDDAVSTPLESLSGFSAQKPDDRRCINILFDGNNYHGTVAGVAYVGGACSDIYNAGIVSTSNPAVAAVALAHEIGHLFNAVHDPTGTDCYAENAIMRASITGVNARFSECSVIDIDTWLGTPNADCLLGSSSNWTAPDPPQNDDDKAWRIVGGIVGSVIICAILFILIEPCIHHSYVKN
tara:strand:- start:3628 stop:4647 length:1020 start_codon:yes stop_codon:yes gene_type:complete